MAIVLLPPTETSRGQVPQGETNGEPRYGLEFEPEEFHALAKVINPEEYIQRGASLVIGESSGSSASTTYNLVLGDKTISLSIRSHSDYFRALINDLSNAGHNFLHNSGSFPNKETEPTFVTVEIEEPNEGYGSSANPTRTRRLIVSPGVIDSLTDTKAREPRHPRTEKLHDYQTSEIFNFITEANALLASVPTSEP